MKQRFKILTQNISADNQKVMISGVEINDLSYNLQLNLTDEIISTEIPIIDNEEIFIESNIDNKYLDLYPSTMIQVNDDDIEEKDGIKIIKKCKLLGISLNSNPNVDSSIKSLRQQIGFKDGK